MSRSTLVLPSGRALGRGLRADERSRRRAPAVPVVAEPAARKTVALRLHAIGNVEAIDTVAVRPQVGGQIVGVHFREGTDVKAGDALFTHRPAALRGGAPPGGGHPGPRRGQREERAARGPAQRVALRAGGPVARAVRRPPQLGGGARRHGARRPGRRRVGPARPRLLRHPLADRRPRGQPPRPARQRREGDRRRPARGDQPGRPRLRLLLAAGAAAGGGDDGPRQAAGSRSRRSWRERRRRPLSGELTFLDNAVDRSTGTIRLKGTFRNKERRLWPGQFVDVRLATGTLPDAVVVPGGGDPGRAVGLVRLRRPQGHDGGVPAGGRRRGGGRRGRRREGRRGGRPGRDRRAASGWCPARRWS